jgi:DNA transformation protein
MAAGQAGLPVGGSPVDARDIEDLFAPVARVHAKRMFGGLGVFVDGLMVALAVRGTLYMKADETSGAEFEAAGAQPFTYERAGREARLGFWTLPDGAFDDPDELARWYALSSRAAIRAAAAKPRRKPRRATRQAT